MTISRVGTSTGTNTAVPVAHAIGDIIVIAAFRATTGTPALPAGYTSIKTQTGSTSSIRIGYRIATATNDAGGTWTNATATVCHVYRSSQYSSGGSVTIGANASTSQTTNTINFPALTMFHGDNTSWVLGFVGANNLTNTIAAHPPSGMTNESSEVSATDQCAGHDTNGTVSSWASTNATTTGTPGGSVSATVELIENNPGTSISNIVQHISYAYDAQVASNEPADNRVFTFDPSLAGNGFVVAVAYPSGATPTVTDNQSNTWPASGAAGTVTSDAGAGNMALQIFRLATATTGTSQITVSFGGVPQQPVKVWITQLFGITGTVNGTAQASAVNAGGVLSPGSMTPTNNNANGGNLILSYCVEAASSSTTSPALFIPETGYSLNDADISWASPGSSGTPNASQFWVQATSAATTPRFYINIGGTDTYNVASIALSLGTQGTAAPSGAGVAPWVNRICYFQDNNTPTSWLVQIPSTGKFGFIGTYYPVAGSPRVSSVTDSDGTSWVQQNPSSGVPMGYTNINQTPKTNRTATLAVTPANNIITVIYYDISNAHTSPIVTTAGTQLTTTTNQSTSGIDQPSITPSAANQLTVAVYQNAQGPTPSIAAPSGAIYDQPTAQKWKGTGTIATTTLTVATTTWGTFDSTQKPELTGAGVTAGTTVQSGTGPTYTIQPSQTVTPAVTMFEYTVDGGSLNFGDGAGHFFNGSSLSAQSWTWNIANQPSNQGSAFAIIFKGPDGGAGPIAKTESVLQAVKRASYY